jgi:hypothetical protein
MYDSVKYGVEDDLDFISKTDDVAFKDLLIRWLERILPAAGAEPLVENRQPTSMNDANTGIKTCSLFASKFIEVGSKFSSKVPLLMVCLATLRWMYNRINKKKKYSHSYWEYGTNYINGKCQGIKEYPYIKSDCTIENHQIDEYLTGDCPPRPMIWYYGPKLRKWNGVVMKKCIHNAWNSAQSRIAMDVLASPKYCGDLREEVFDKFEEWIEVFFDKIWKQIPMVQPISEADWKKTFTGSKLLEMDEAEAVVDEEVISKTWMKRNNGRKVFLKYEMLVIHPDKDKEARIIMAPEPSIKYLSGPYCWTLGQQLKKKFSCFVTNPENMHYEKSVYASGLDRGKLGEVFGFFVDSVSRQGKPVQLTMDHDRFDLHHHKRLFDVQWKLFNKLVHANPNILLWQQDSNDMRGKFVKFLIEFAKLTIRGSGGGETTGGNTVLNITTATWAWIITLVNNGIITALTVEGVVKQWMETPLYALYLGDDNNTVTTEEISKLHDEFKMWMSFLGWSLKIDPGPIHDAEFCSSVFVPCDLQRDGVWTSQYVMINKVGKIWVKFAHSIKQRGGILKQMAYMKAILQGYRELDCIPFLAAWRSRLMELIDTNDLVVGNKFNFEKIYDRQMEVYRREKRIQYRVRLGGEFICRPNANTEVWLRQRYNISMSEVEDLSDYFRSIEAVNVWLDHDVIDKICNVDCYHL